MKFIAIFMFKLSPKSHHLPHNCYTVAISPSCPTNFLGIRENDRNNIIDLLYYWLTAIS
jgi:hypothetical protein